MTGYRMVDPIGHCPQCNIGWLFWREHRAGVLCGRWACLYSALSWQDALRDGARPIMQGGRPVDPEAET